MDVIAQITKDEKINQEIRDMEKWRKEYGNPIANKWMALDPFMNKEYKALTGTGSGEMLYPLTMEDIYKYGKRDEVQFLLEDLSLKIKSDLLSELRTNREGVLSSLGFSQAQQEQLKSLDAMHLYQKLIAENEEELREWYLARVPKVKRELEPAPIGTGLKKQP